MSEIHTRQITEPCAWMRADIAGSDDWQHGLTGAEIDDLDRALKGIRNPGGRLIDITRDDFPLPVLSVCTGHAVAQGAFTLLASDVRFGAAGAFKLGLNEVVIGLTIPHYGVEIARMRLSPSWFQHATITGAMYSPEEALRAGFLDALYPAEELMTRAKEEAQRLRKLNMPAHVGTKRRARAAALKLIRDSIEQELVVPS